MHIEVYAGIPYTVCSDEEYCWLMVDEQDATWGLVVWRSQLGIQTANGDNKAKVQAASTAVAPSKSDIYRGHGAGS